MTKIITAHDVLQSRADYATTETGTQLTAADVTQGLANEQDLRAYLGAIKYARTDAYKTEKDGELMKPIAAYCDTHALSIEEVQEIKKYRASEMIAYHMDESTKDSIDLAILLFSKKSENIEHLSIVKKALFDINKSDGAFRRDDMVGSAMMAGQISLLMQWPESRKEILDATYQRYEEKFAAKLGLNS